MWRSLCQKLYCRPSQLLFAFDQSSIRQPDIRQTFVENRDFCLPHLHLTPRRNIVTTFGMEQVALLSQRGRAMNVELNLLLLVT